MRLATGFALLFIVSAGVQSAAQSTSDQPTAHDPVLMRNRGVAFLQTMQRENGSWTTDESVGITAIVTAGLLRSGLSADDAVVERALKYLVHHQF